MHDEQGQGTAATQECADAVVARPWARMLGHRGMTDRGVRITRHELVAFATVRASSGGQPTLSVRPGQRNALLWVPNLRKARGESKPK